MATITIHQINSKENVNTILCPESIKRIKAEAMRREREKPNEGCNTCVFLNPRLLDGTDENMETICTHPETTLPDILIGTSGLPCPYYQSIFALSRPSIAQSQKTV